ncbi:MAG: glycosyltransferase [Chloroflexota bacterium]|nr:glycosyltransferase [Chloroflexota bacterium]
MTNVTRVLHAIRTVDARQTGGAEELLLRLSQALARRGRFDPIILRLRKPSPTADPSKDFDNRARALGVKVLPMSKLRWRYGWLRGLPRGLRVGVIHMHGQRANYAIWALRRLFPGTWGSVPLVATVHGWVQDNLVRKVVTRLELVTLGDCDHVITVSELQRKTLIGLGFAPGRVSVVRPGIPNMAEGAQGLEARRIAREKWRIPVNAYVIAAIGRLSTEKRFDLYLETCAALAKEIPDTRFLLVGGGKQEANLKALASSLGLDDLAIFTGLTDDMPGVYAATDLVMLTSDTEGTPHVLLEAMSLDIPIIATEVGGIPEFVTSGEHGILVPAGDKDALVQATLRVHDDPALSARLVEGGREVAARFTVERMAEGVEKVYSRVLSRSKRRGQ